MKAHDWMLGALVSVSFVLAGCKGAASAAIDHDVGGDPGTGIGKIVACFPNPDAEETGEAASSLQTVYFDYDSSLLRADALRIIPQNAELLRKNNAPIQIAGHCDERGTQDYNFALGEMRAIAVRNHLMKLGIDGHRLTTISYGEEKPASEGHYESAWAQNRRCEFHKAI